jgi:uncharacterized protein
MDFNELVLIDGLYFKKFTEIPFTGQTTGQIQGLFKNGTLDGLYIEYYDNGRVKKKGSYKNNNEDGKWLYYDVNGKLEKEYKFENGYHIYQDTKKDEHETYIGEFADGRKHGKGTLTYIDDGVEWQKYKGEFKWGEMHGKGTLTYIDDGVEWQKYKGEFKWGKMHGKGTILSFTDEGKENMKKVGEWKDDLKHGLFSYYKNGKIKEKIKYKNDIKNGYYESFYQNGKKEYLGEYKNGKKTGYWTFCNLDGSINEQFSGFYKDDKRSDIN